MVPNGTQMVPVYPASLLATIPPAPARTEWRLKTRRNQDWNVYACSVTQSCLILCDFMNNSLPRLFHLWNFPGNCGVDCHFLLQGIFLTQGLSPHLFLLRQWQSLYHCLTWEAYWNVPQVNQINLEVTLRNTLSICGLCWHITEHVEILKNLRNFVQLIIYQKCVSRQPFSLKLF